MDTSDGSPQDIVTIRGLDSTHIWAYVLGRIWVWNGSLWKPNSPRSFWLQIHDFWASDANDIWGVGENGIIPHSNGAAWSDSTQIVNTRHIPPNDLWVSKREVWLSGQYGVHYDGTNWNYTNPIQWSTAVWGLDPTHVWSLGFFNYKDTASLVYSQYWDGANWISQGQIYLNIDVFGLTNMWGFSSKDIWGLGNSLHDPRERGLILHWNGIKWTRIPSNTGPTVGLRGLWGASPNDIWAGVDNGDGLFHWDGREWKRFNTDINISAIDIWGISANDVWAVSYNGSIFHWNGTTWTKHKEFTNMSFNSIWGSDTNHVWAIDSRFGKIVFWNGTTWTEQDSGTEGPLSKIRGSGPDDVWIRGTGTERPTDFILRYKK